MTPNIFGRQQRAALALLAAMLSLAGSYLAFRWVLIKYWEWQHDGRPMKITLWADNRAVAPALVASALVFYATFKWSQRR